MEKKTCVGCSMCKYICPYQAIEMVEDAHGFVYPQINEEKCVKCGLCDRKCGNVHLSNENECYAAINKNNDERLTSSSGGIFPLLAQYVFEQGGVVCGAKFDENMKVVHDFANNMQEAKKFKGSKYVRSDISRVFDKIKDYLEEGKYVLFVGTPCQVNSIKVFLGKEYEKLILCDILCHSNPPQKIFSKYINYLEKKHNKKIIDFSFRDKTVGWQGSNCRAFFEDGTSAIVDNLYSRAFLKGAISYEACYDCKFSGIDRAGDITLGDFWGVEILYPEFYDENGVSLILVNNEKGKRVFNDISDKLKIQKIKREEALKYNHNAPIKKHENYDKIMAQIDSEDFIKCLDKYTKIAILKKVVAKLKRFLHF